jgi:hypothetical protein
MRLPTEIYLTSKDADQQAAQAINPQLRADWLKIAESYRTWARQTF